MGENKRKKIYRVLDGGRCSRTFARPAVTFAHSFQEDRFIAAVMNEPRIRNRRKDIEEFGPYELLAVPSSAQKAVVNSTSPVPTRMPIR